MKLDKDTSFTMLDGTPEEQEKATEKFLGMLTEDEIKESMSEKFDYLDEN